MLIKKLSIFVNFTITISEFPNTPQKTQIFENFVAYVKTLLKKLSEIQTAEAFLMYNSLDVYLQILAQILFRSEVYPSRINKLALIAIYRVVNTNIYNQQNSHDPSNS